MDIGLGKACFVIVTGDVIIGRIAIAGVEHSVCAGEGGGESGIMAVGVVCENLFEGGVNEVGFVGLFVGIAGFVREDVEQGERNHHEGEDDEAEKEDCAEDSTADEAKN